jgi:tripartite-type tricarboxylate transporter receptor subunit TctC
MKKFIILFFITFFFVPSASIGQEVMTQIYVPNPVGGVTDAMARFIATELKNDKVNVVNIPGALGGEAFRKAHRTKNPAIFGIGDVIVNPVLHGKDVTYNIRENFSEIIMIGYSPIVITVRKSIQANTIKEFQTYVKQNVPDLKYAGGGAINNISAVEFMSSIGLTGRKIQYRGGGTEPAKSVAIEETDFHFGNLTISLPLIQANRVKAIGINTPTRHELVPEIPTIREQMGYSYKAQGVFGIGIPNSLDENTRKTWKKLILDIVKTKEYTENLKRVGAIKLEPVIEGSQYDMWINEQDKFYESIIKKYSITN